VVIHGAGILCESPKESAPAYGPVSSTNVYTVDALADSRWPKFLETHPEATVQGWSKAFAPDLWVLAGRIYDPSSRRSADQRDRVLSSPKLAHRISCGFCPVSYQCQPLMWTKNWG
jgi:hypothetical protein